MDRAEASKKIDELMKQAADCVSEAERIADEHDLEFSMDLGGYGMGGWYSSGEWQASSHSC